MLLKNICIILSFPFGLISNLQTSKHSTKNVEKKKFSVSNQGFELFLYYSALLLISEDKWRNCKSREMKATVAKKRKARRRRKQSKGGKHCLVICSTHCQTMANLLNTQKENYRVVENHIKKSNFCITLRA